MTMPELEPMNRTEALLAGEDLEPTNRLEYFLKQAGSGGSSSIVPTPAAEDSGKVLTAGADGTASWQSSGIRFLYTAGRTPSATNSIGMPSDVQSYIHDALASLTTTEQKNIWLAEHIQIYVDGCFARPEAASNRLAVTSYRPFITSDGVAYCKHFKLFVIVATTGDISVSASTITDSNGTTVTPSSDPFNSTIIIVIVK